MYNFSGKRKKKLVRVRSIEVVESVFICVGFICFTLTDSTEILSNEAEPPICYDGPTLEYRFIIIIVLLLLFVLKLCD
jgi:hypothetical protein